ncbi:MAG: hypothetical protein FJ184_11410 [Gammaproteobacteria bacterium]|nr:hypothetical protein [Gammaproteobacteria bacterium]
MDSEAVFQIVILAIVTGILVGILIAVYRMIVAAKDAVVRNQDTIKGAVKNAVAIAVTKSSDAVNEVQKLATSDPKHIDARFFKLAEEEFRSSARNASLHTKCLALENGDPIKAEARYIRDRAVELKRGIS